MSNATTLCHCGGGKLQGKPTIEMEEEFTRALKLKARLSDFYLNRSKTINTSNFHRFQDRGSSSFGCVGVVEDESSTRQHVGIAGEEEEEEE